jgi:hypothetical protein
MEDAKELNTFGTTTTTNVTIAENRLKKGILQPTIDGLASVFDF